MCNRFAQNIIFKKQMKKLEKHEPIQDIHKVTLPSPCLWASFHPQTPLSTSNQLYPQSSEIALNLGMKG
jgi:hypothetical protein